MYQNAKKKLDLTCVFVVFGYIYVLKCVANFIPFSCDGRVLYITPTHKVKLEQQHMTHAVCLYNTLSRTRPPPTCIQFSTYVRAI
jgi:hypothetical protein